MAVQPARSLTAMAVALVSAACLAGCAAKQSQTAASSRTSPTSTTSPPASAPAAPTMAARMEKWIDLKAGDCLAAPPSTDPAEVTVTVVDCGTPHLAEAYLRADIPVDAAVTTTANQQCGAGFTEYTGLAVNGSPYTINYLIDSEQDRTANNPLPSTVICLLQGAQGQSLTESARR